MTDREAMLALAAPEPEPFRQVRPTAEDNGEWQAWHADRLAALARAESVVADALEAQSGGYERV